MYLAFQRFACCLNLAVGKPWQAFNLDLLQIIIFKMYPPRLDLGRCWLYYPYSTLSILYNYFQINLITFVLTYIQ